MGLQSIGSWFVFLQFLFVVKGKTLVSDANEFITDTEVGWTNDSFDWTVLQTSARAWSWFALQTGTATEFVVMVVEVRDIQVFTDGMIGIGTGAAITFTTKFKFFKLYVYTNK